MLKGYYVQIPPTLAEVLADIGGTDPEADFDVIVDAACSAFFSFYNPQKITAVVAQNLEKFILNYFITRRIGSGNVRKWKQYFRNKWCAIMPYYERLLDTQENEDSYFENPILNVDIHKGETGSGTRDTDTDRTRNNTLNHAGEGTHNTDESGTKTHTGSSTESSNSTEINRFSDTPQGDSGDIWERTASGGVNLTDLYLTDIRGITDAASRSGSDSATDNTTLDRDETMTDSFTDTGEETENTTVDEETTTKKDSDDLGYSGQSPVELMMKYRESFMRVYEDIAQELEPVFYNLVEVDDLVDFV